MERNLRATKDEFKTWDGAAGRDERSFNNWAVRVLNQAASGQAPTAQAIVEKVQHVMPSAPPPPERARPGAVVKPRPTGCPRHPGAGAVTTVQGIFCAAEGCPNQLD